MEKLVELLNEYIKEKKLGNTVKEIDDDFFVNNYNNWDGYLCEQVMSKNFGFIERLVENDKISFVKKNEDGLEFNWQIMDDCMDTFAAYPVDMDTGELSDDCTDMLIMILSIKDNPLEYLCSILKE